MVQKYQSPVRVYKHPFELIMAVSTLDFNLLFGVLVFSVFRFDDLYTNVYFLICLHCSTFAFSVLCL